jgi:hypothetical protein
MAKISALLWIVAAAVLSTGCGSDDDTTVCEDAADRVEQCGVSASSIRQSACSGNNKIYSECVADNQSSLCSGLADPTDLNNPFNACISQLTSD